MPEPVMSEYQRYLNIIATYNNQFKQWVARSEKIIKRYRDDTRSQTNNETARFNILWSNVETLSPAVFARLPKADVSRRFGDNDPVGRVASLLIERALDYEIEHYSDFRSAMQLSVQDRFLGGRGISWVRYDPHIKTQELQLTDDVKEPEGAEEAALDSEPGGGEAAPEEIDYECSPSDYVHWKDFGHSIARTWEEVGQVWRIVYMTRSALEERFGEEIAKKVPLDSGPDPLKKDDDADGKTHDRAAIYELWDKEKKKAVWLAKGCSEILDEQKDPLGLDNFFPCPKPLYATTTSDNLVPVPDFVLYQDQANELDILCDRIDGLIKALRVRGVYDASQPALQRLMTEGDNNTLIPVDKWAQFAEKGGLEGCIDLVDLDMIAKALVQAYAAQENVTAQIYQITGISDIIRGATEASETATAQRIKGQYANLRLKSMQDAVAMYATEILRIKAHIICTKYQPQTIITYAAAGQMAEADQMLVPQAIELLKQDPLRNFRIDVAADSLVLMDEMQEKQDRMEFLEAFATFMPQAVSAGAQVPELTPALMGMIKYAVGGFKQARQIEGVIDQALQKLDEKAKQVAQAGPQPSPEEKVAQAQIQADQQKAQAEMQVSQQQAQMEMMQERYRAQQEASLEAQKMQMQAQFDQWKAELDASTKTIIAQINARAHVQAASLKPEPEAAAE